MNNKISNQPSQTQKSYYAGIQGGVYVGANDDPRATATAVFGTKLEKGSSYLQAQVGAGNVLSANLEIGKNLDLGKGFQATLAAQGGAILNNLSSHVSSTVSLNDFYEHASKDYHDGVSKVGIKAMCGAHREKFDIKIGAEAGYRTTYGNASIVNNIAPDMVATSVSVGSKSGLYVTPKVQAELHPNKKISFNADGSIYEGNVGFRYNF